MDALFSKEKGKLISDEREEANRMKLNEAPWNDVEGIQTIKEKVVATRWNPDASSSLNNPNMNFHQEDDHPVPHQQVETEKLREGRFVVKVEWRRGSGAAGDVQRVIESLEVTMTSILVADVNRNPNHMLTTAFVKVKKELRMTEEELYELIMARFRSQT